MRQEPDLSRRSLVVRVYDWLQSHGKTKALLLKLTGDQLYLREYLRQNIAAPNHPLIPA